MFEALKRLLFVVLVLALGFGAERSIQTLSKRKNTLFSTSKNFKIAVIGGSIAMGLGGQVEYQLRRLTGRSDIEVIDASIPIANAQVAASLVDTTMKMEAPKIVILMLGLYEDRSTKENRTLPIVDAMQNDDPEKAQRELESLLTSRSYTQAATFFVQYGDELRSEQYKGRFSATLKKEIARKLEVSPKDIYDQNQLLALNAWLWWLQGINRKSSRGVNLDLLSKGIQMKVDEIIAETKDWPSEVEEENYDEFVALGSDESERALRGWFWLAWTNRLDRNERDVVRFYTNQPQLLGNLLPPLGFVAKNKILSESLRNAQPQMFYAAVRANDVRGFWSNLEPHQTEKPPSQNPIRFIDLFSAIRKTGAEPVLLRYPNLRLQFVDEIGAANGVRVIGDEHAFDEKIRANGRDLYFLNDDHGTGHLTDAGFEVFAKAVAEELVPLIDKTAAL